MKTLLLITVIIALCTLTSIPAILVSLINEDDRNRYADEISKMVKEIWHDLDEAIIIITLVVMIIGAAMFIGGTSIIAEIGIGICLFGPFITEILISAHEFIDEHFIKK